MVKSLLTLCIGALWLSGIQAFADPQLDELLERTGRLVERFWQQVPSFTCMELVTQQKMNKRGKIEYKADSIFDYLALTSKQGDAITIEELRLPQKKTRDKANKPSLLKTNGFPSLLLIFHPQYQANYRYQPAPESAEDGKLLPVKFEHIEGMRSTCALVLQERIYPLDLQGTAWIDRETGIIQKMTANLIAPLKDINIKVFSVEVEYKPQVFPSEPEVRWLPSTTVINVQTALQHWRNIHRFSQYKRFTVQSSEAISK